MSIKVTAPELADALDSLGAGKPGMASGELAEWLLADVVAGHLLTEALGDLHQVHRCSNDCEHAIRAVDSQGHRWAGGRQLS
jgi:hypothetical protein